MKITVEQLEAYLNKWAEENKSPNMSQSNLTAFKLGALKNMYVALANDRLFSKKYTIPEIKKL